MYQIGEYIVDNSNGICRVEDIVCPDFVTDKTKRYYLLIPIKEAVSKVYVPIENAENRFRKILTEEEINVLLSQLKDIESIWVTNDREREQIYKEAVRSSDPKQLIGIIKTLYFRREKRTNEGKKSTVVDERYFKQAENNLYSEIGFVLNLNNTEVENLIKEKIE